MSSENLIDISEAVDKLNGIRMARLAYRMKHAYSPEWDENLDWHYSIMCGNEEGAYDMLRFLLEQGFGKFGPETWELKLGSISPYEYIFIDHVKEYDDDEQERHSDSDC